MSQFKYSLLVVGPAPPPSSCASCDMFWPWLWHARLVSISCWVGRASGILLPWPLRQRSIALVLSENGRYPPQKSKFTGEDDDQPSTLGLPIFRHSRFDTCLWWCFGMSLDDSWNESAPHERRSLRWLDIDPFMVGQGWTSSMAQRTWQENCISVHIRSPNSLDWLLGDWSQRIQSTCKQYTQHHFPIVFGSYSHWQTGCVPLLHQVLILAQAAYTGCARGSCWHWPCRQQTAQGSGASWLVDDYSGYIWFYNVPKWYIWFYNVLYMVYMVL